MSFKSRTRVRTAVAESSGIKQPCMGFSLPNVGPLQHDQGESAWKPNIASHAPNSRPAATRLEQGFGVSLVHPSNQSQSLASLTSNPKLLAVRPTIEKCCLNKAIILVVTYSSALHDLCDPRKILSPRTREQRTDFTSMPSGNYLAKRALFGWG